MSTARQLAPATRDGSASRRVAAGIREAIAHGELPPGSRLRQEEIAERFGASRVPVREALKELEIEGLVTLVANSGAWVSQLTMRECEEVYQTRERLEPLLLHYSAPHLSADDLDAMDALARAMAETEDVVEFLRLDREFHMLSYSGGETLMLGDLVRRLWNTTQQYRRAYTMLVDVHAQRIVHDEHRHIVATLRDGDVEGAAHTVEGHIRRTRRMLAAHPEIFTPTG
ncbi:GntR family transcriptional regulator [Agromyces sp. Marseille-P2726]|uniref:GntR family transcriptional regulator n=1 Tax=Agromyces sp. Marseille-P2726 TaxID=2709132 RepID=UPI00156D6B94|nr:GntR family transcriptional regulator [Agromyces sp. Marseille-P2726]